MVQAYSFRGLSLSKIIVLATSILGHVTAQSQASYTCANLADNNKHYTTGGITFQLKCGYGTIAKSLPSIPAASLKECADKCAQDTKCQSCDWTPGTGMCNPKSEYIPLVQNGAHNTWFPISKRPTRECPADVDVLTAPKVNPQVVDTPRCPTDNGNMFVSADGAYWTFICCAHSKDNDEISGTRSVVKSSNECANKCASTKGCLSFVISSVGQTNPPQKFPDAVGTCKLYKSGQFETKGCSDDTHDYGYITAPPAVDSPDTMTIACATECPLADGREYKSKGELFHIDCAKRHGTQVIHESTQKNLKACMDACSKYVPCHSVDYHTSSQKCYFSKHHGAPTIGAPGFQSAYSLGCAGACDGDDCCVDSGTQLSGGDEHTTGPVPDDASDDASDKSPPGGDDDSDIPGDDGPPGGDDTVAPPGDAFDDGPPGGDDDSSIPGDDNGPPGGDDNVTPPGDALDDGPPGGDDDGDTPADDDGPPGGDAPAAPKPLSAGQCPPDNGKTRTVDGITYTVMCKKAYSTGLLKSVPNMSEESCVKACSADSTCQGANFNTQSSVCELHRSWVGQPKYTGDVTYWIAYRPLKQR